MHDDDALDSEEKIVIIATKDGFSKNTVHRALYFDDQYLPVKKRKNDSERDKLA